MATTDLRDAVVVITGASSGIGRATALAFAREGANVVVAARRERPLYELAAECEQHGVRALPVPTDVRDQHAVNHLARQAIGRFGRVDVWVNDAAVNLYATFEESPPDVFRGVFETNLFGCVHGCRAILPHFRQRGQGVIINLSSVLGTMGAPYQSAYAASKFAIRGFSESLRQELRDTGIHVSTILPAAIDTPLFQHAANFSGREVKPLHPTYDADEVAEAIVACAVNPEREVTVGSAGRMIRFTRMVAPGIQERMFAEQVEIDHFMDQPAGPRAGNVFQPVPYGTDTGGGWKSGDSSTGRSLARVGLLATATAGAAWLLFHNRNGHSSSRAPGQRS